MSSVTKICLNFSSLLSSYNHVFSCVLFPEVCVTIHCSKKSSLRLSVPVYFNSIYIFPLSSPFIIEGDCPFFTPLPTPLNFKIPNLIQSLLFLSLIFQQCSYNSPPSPPPSHVSYERSSGKNVPPISLCSLQIFNVLTRNWKMGLRGETLLATQLIHGQAPVEASPWTK